MDTGKTFEVASDQCRRALDSLAKDIRAGIIVYLDARAFRDRVSVWIYISGAYMIEQYDLMRPKGGPGSDPRLTLPEIHEQLLDAQRDWALLEKTYTSEVRYRFRWEDEDSVTEDYESEEELRLHWVGEGATLETQLVLPWTKKEEA